MPKTPAEVKETQQVLPSPHWRELEVDGFNGEGHVTRARLATGAGADLRVRVSLRLWQVPGTSTPRRLSLRLHAGAY